MQNKVMKRPYEAVTFTGRKNTDSDICISAVCAGTGRLFVVHREASWEGTSNRPLPVENMLLYQVKARRNGYEEQ